MNLCNALLFISLIQCSCSYNILVYILLIGKSHVDFGTMLVNLLADRGHTVVSSLNAKQSINSLFILTQSWRKYFEDLMFARMNDQVSGNGTSKARRIKNFGWEGIGESLVLNCQNNFYERSLEPASCLFIEFLRATAIQSRWHFCVLRHDKRSLLPGHVRPVRRRVHQRGQLWFGHRNWLWILSILALRHRKNTIGRV